MVLDVAERLATMFWCDELLVTKLWCNELLATTTTLWCNELLATMFWCKELLAAIFWCDANIVDSRFVLSLKKERNSHTSTPITVCIVHCTL